MFVRYWSWHMMNCLLTGLASAVPGITSHWSLHIFFASSSYMRDLGLVDPDRSLTPGLLSKQF